MADAPPALGAAPRASAAPAAIPTQRAWAEVDLDAFAHNIRTFADLAHPARLMAVVKADAYGHGTVAAARSAVAAGAASLAVATVSEGLPLRRAGVAVPILILGPAWGEEEAAVAADLTLTVVDAAGLDAAHAAAESAGRPARVHLKIDTGMTRLGAAPDGAGPLVARACALEGVVLEGTFTHLAAPETDPDFTLEQARRFERAAALVRERVPAAVAHVTSTAGLLALRGAHGDVVRVGLGLYGLLPAPELGPGVDLRPVMSVWTRVLQVHDVREARTVGYGRTFSTAGPTRIATVGFGYADGYPRTLSNRGQMLCGGRACAVAGRVSMDYVTLDAGDAVVRRGDPVLVFGPALPADVVAEAAGTISYELLCRLAPRVPRIYLAAGEVVGVRTAHETWGVAARDPHPAAEE